MLTPERHQMILRILEDHQVATAGQLAEATSSSASTIRRDLIQLEQDNQLRRFHGGAEKLRTKSEEVSVTDRADQYKQEKIAIARHAADHVQSGYCIYLDAGTTTYHMIDHLREDIIVVTNGLTLIERCVDRGLQTYLIGGRVKNITKAMIGHGALNALNQYRFDQCFIGMNGFNLKDGMTTPDPEEALIKQTALQLSTERYVLADRSKFNKTSFAHVADLAAAAIVTNSDDDDEHSLTDYQDQTRIEVVTT